MIYTERVINVKNGVATIDQPIILFRGDRNIEIVFEIINSKFKFSEKGNYILDIGAKYGQLAVDTPDGTDLFTDIAECLDGKVIFKITGDMINEIAENGFYSFHVRLFNDDKTSRVTIPPIMEGIEIREPIVIEGDAIFPIVDMGGADIAPIDSDEETFIDENGKLDIQWKTGDIISSTRLNQMVEFVNVMEEKLVSEDNLKDYATIEYVDAKLNNIDSVLNAHEGFINDIESTSEQAKDIAAEARNTINGKYNELSGQIHELFSKDDVFEASVAVAEANAQAALAGVKDRATVSYVDQKDTELSQRIENLENNPVTPDLSDYDTRIETLEEDTAQLKIRVNSNASAMTDLEDVCIEFDDRIKVVENILDDFDNSDGVYDIASKTYVDEQIGEFQEGIDDYIADIVQGEISEYGLDNISKELDNRPKWEDLTYLDEAIDDHNTRIEALENGQTNPEAPDLSGYATTEYVDGQISEIQTAIEILPNDPANPTPSECVTRQYVHDHFVTHAVYTLKIKGIQNDLLTLNDWTVEEVDKLKYGKADNSDIDNLEELHDDHENRITALEQIEAPDLSNYVTLEQLNDYAPIDNIENLENNVIPTLATKEELNTRINNAIGNINAILDAINGEEI